MQFLFWCLHGHDNTKKCSEAVPEDLSDLARVNLKSDMIGSTCLNIEYIEQTSQRLWPAPLGPVHRREDQNCRS